MQGDQGPRENGRGVYVARRIVAAIVVLLLLALLIPWACQALVGPGEEPEVPEVSKKGDVGVADGGGDETAKDEYAVGGSKETDEPKGPADSSTSDGEEGADDSLTDGVEATGVDENEVSIELEEVAALDLATPVAGPEAFPPVADIPVGGLDIPVGGLDIPVGGLDIPVGGLIVDQIPQIPDAANQPVAPLAPLASP